MQKDRRNHSLTPWDCKDRKQREIKGFSIEWAKYLNPFDSNSKQLPLDSSKEAGTYWIPSCKHKKPKNFQALAPQDRLSLTTYVIHLILFIFTSCALEVLWAPDRETTWNELPARTDRQSLHLLHDSEIHPEIMQLHHAQWARFKLWNRQDPLSLFAFSFF